MEKEIERQDKKTPSRYVQKNHYENQILGNKSAGPQKRRKIKSFPKEVNFSLLSIVEPNIFEEARKYEHWVNAMNEELDQIEKN